jgi:hypothetical protein
VAVCDRCGHLLLAYGDTRDYEEAKRALEDEEMAFETEAFGRLQVIAKPRLGRS